MSGNTDAFLDLLANMCHGATVSILGIPVNDVAIDWNIVIFNMLTLKSIYGREMYEAWYKMSEIVEPANAENPNATITKQSAP
ncbi:MAG: threonine 3-dehydrogenase [Candidatus Endobugula sp.]|jgi:threonine 3-dehydrogenase